MVFPGLPETSKMKIFASVVHHLGNINVYVSKIYPSGLIFGDDIWGSYVWDVNWVTYSGALYMGAYWQDFMVYIYVYIYMNVYVI